MKYAWTITKDYNHERDRSLINAVGMFGPVDSEYWGNARQQSSRKLANDPNNLKFAMAKDGDVLYEGFYVYNGDDEADGLEPLKSFGCPIGGCDRIGYNTKSNDPSFPELYIWTYLPRNCRDE